MTATNEIALLPEPFADLQAFARRWAMPGLAAREAARGATTGEEREAFYAAIKDRVTAILDYLDAKPVARLDAGESALLNLVLSYIHVSLAVEVQGRTEPFHASMRQHMRITHAPAEPWNGNAAAP